MWWKSQIRPHPIRPSPASQCLSVPVSLWCELQADPAERFLFYPITGAEANGFRQGPLAHRPTEHDPGRSSQTVPDWPVSVEPAHRASGALGAPVEDRWLFLSQITLVPTVWQAQASLLSLVTSQCLFLFAAPYRRSPFASPTLPLGNWLATRGEWEAEGICACVLTVQAAVFLEGSRGTGLFCCWLLLVHVAQVLAKTDFASCPKTAAQKAAQKAAQIFGHITERVVHKEGKSLINNRKPC